MAIPKTLKEISKDKAEKIIQKHIKSGTGRWEGSAGYSDFVYNTGSKYIINKFDNNIKIY